MTQSPNKGFELQATGSNSGTWGGVLNDDVITYIDDNLGGRTALSLSSSNVTLTASESRSAILYLSGVLTANITITTECIGFFYVENRTTGAFTVTIRNNLVAPSGSGFSSTVAVVARNSRVSLISDSVQGVRIAGQNGFASGDALISATATAPIGYTISTAVTNYALRLVSSAAGGTGGTSGFTSIFADRTIGRANLPSFTMSDTITTSNHTHKMFVNAVGGGSGGVTSTSQVYVEGRGSGGADYYYSMEGSNSTATVGETSSDGGQSIVVTVSSGGSGTALNFNVAYLDVNNIVKD